MKPIAQYITVLLILLLGSCARQEIDGDVNGLPHGAVSINYSLPVATVVETRSDKTPDESELRSMHVLVFEDKNGVADKFVEIKTAQITASGTSVTLTSLGGARRIVYIVANAGAIIATAGNVFNPATATWTSIKGAMMLGSIPATTQVAALPTTPLPMFSAAVLLEKTEPGVTEIGTVAAPIKLLSGYAKVSLASADNRLTITGIALHNAPAEGGELFGETISSAERRVNYHEAASYSFTQSANYIYPTSTTTHTVDLIVKGHYTGDSEDTFYRIALSAPQADGSRKKFDFLANYHYAVKLTQVGTHGYPTIEEAIANEPSNIIYDIEIGDMTGEVVSNGQYYMSLSALTYEITGNNTAIKIATLRTDAPVSALRGMKIIANENGIVQDIALNGNNIVLSTKNIAGSATVRVTVGNLHQDIKITNTDLTASRQISINGIQGKSYAVGETVTIVAPLEERRKFRSWTTDIPINTPTTKAAANMTRPTISFTMPDADVKLTVQYDDAPLKVTINKPARISKGLGGPLDAELVKETPTSYIRYYAANDVVYISTPEFDPSTGTKWDIWDKSEATHGQISYYINNESVGGGGQKPATKFKIQGYIATKESVVELTPKYLMPPYWSAQPTENGHIVAQFIDRVNPDPALPTIPRGATFKRAFNDREKTLIMRTLNTLANTFDGAPARPIKIVFAVFDSNRPGTGGVTDPMGAVAASGHDSPKEFWTASDFGGIATGVRASSTKFEAVWRDKLKIIPGDADQQNSFVGFCDGVILLDDRYITYDCYKGDSEIGIPPTTEDFETLIMHELAHIVCYHPKFEDNTTGGMHAYDVFIADKNDPANKRVLTHTMTKDAAAIFYSEKVKPYYGGAYVDILPNDFSHLFTEIDSPYGSAVGTVQRGGGARRRFTDYELMMLQEMGWKIKPTAWKKHPPK